MKSTLITQKMSAVVILSVLSHPAFAWDPISKISELIPPSVSSILEKDCIDVYRDDYYYGEIINKIYAVYNPEIDSLHRQALNSAMSGGGGFRSFSAMINNMARSAKPYADRRDEVRRERDSKVEVVKYEQERLVYQNPKCYN